MIYHNSLNISSSTDTFNFLCARFQTMFMRMQKRLILNKEKERKQKLNNKSLYL